MAHADRHADGCMNPFLALVADSRQRGLCTRPWCTTCAATEFREALRRDRAGLAADLASLPLADLEVTPDWGDPLRLALDELGSAELMDHVLQAWLPHLDDHVRLADLVVFYYVRRGALFAPMSVDTLQEWLGRSIDVANQSRDSSLVESLIYTLGGQIKEHPELVELVKELQPGSRAIALALERAT